MNKMIKALPLYVALAMMGPIFAWAQTTAEQPSVDSQLSFAEDTDEVGKPYTREVNDDWEMRCIRMEEGEEPCQMYQMMDDGQGAPVAEISVFRLPEGGKAVAGATLIVPLETSLTDQLKISIDGDKARRYPFAFCNPIGCYVRLGLTAEDVAAFKRGSAATISIVPALAPDQKVDLALSLKGFTASFDSASVVEQ
jgi:invasion protein IalB